MFSTFHWCQSRSLKIYVIIGGLVEKFEVESYVGRGGRCAWRVSLASACHKDRFQLIYWLLVMGSINRYMLCYTVPRHSFVAERTHVDGGAASSKMFVSLLAWDDGHCQRFHSRPYLTCSVHVKSLKMVESGMSPYILKHVFWTMQMKCVPLSSVKMERKWYFFLLMFGTWIECLLWYAAARNLAAIEQP